MVSTEIAPGFDIGFDKRIPEDTKREMRSFVGWIESNYRIPVTLWVDFEYRHYLKKRDGKRVGYLFYWDEMDAYPVFNKKEEIPQSHLPVRTEKSTMEEILTSFIEAIFDYYAWICKELKDGYEPDEEDVEEIFSCICGKEAEKKESAPAGLSFDRADALLLCI